MLFAMLVLQRDGQLGLTKGHGEDQSQESHWCCDAWLSFEVVSQ